MMTTPNAERRAWLDTHLKHAAGVLGVTTMGTPVFGWHDRTIGTRVTTTDGEHWLRVVAELSYWASGDFWTGNLDAQAISAVPKPQLLTELDWSSIRRRDRSRRRGMDLRPRRPALGQPHRTPALHAGLGNLGQTPRPVTTPPCCTVPAS